MTDVPLVLDCNPTTTVGEAIRLLETEGIDYLVIVEGGRAVSILSLRDLLDRPPDPPLDPSTPVRDVKAATAAHRILERSP